jgi:hypothetical protein
MFRRLALVGFVTLAAAMTSSCASMQPSSQVAPSGPLAVAQHQVQLNGARI